MACPQQGTQEEEHESDDVCLFRRAEITNEKDNAASGVVCADIIFIAIVHN